MPNKVRERIKRELLGKDGFLLETAPRYVFEQVIKGDEVTKTLIFDLDGSTEVIDPAEAVEKLISQNFKLNDEAEINASNNDWVLKQRQTIRAELIDRIAEVFELDLDVIFEYINTRTRENNDV